MIIDTKTEKSTSVVSCQGNITYDDGCREVRDRIKEEIEAGITKVILDLGKVNYMDSCGIETLVTSHLLLEKAGGHLQLRNLPSRISHLLEITHLQEILDVEHTPPSS